MASHSRVRISTVRGLAISASMVMAALVLALPMVPSAKAQTFEDLYSFTGKVGAGPYGQLAMDAAGNLYGAANYGGSDQFGGSGSVYKLSPTGKAARLYAFTGGSDGGTPYAGVILDESGNLYGTTKDGGVSNTTCGTAPPAGCGIVYKVDKTGKETVLHAFTGGSDGWEPLHELTRDAAGNLYGTTEAGGGVTGGACATSGCGTVFRISTTGKETILHAFTGKTDGNFPNSRLVLDPSGNLYGTTPWGGILTGVCVTEGLRGCGVLFKVSKTGKDTILHSFTNGADGAMPTGNLVADANGNLYGCTSVGGAFGNGTIYEFSAAGEFSVLYNFASVNFCGGLVRDVNGNFFGIASGSPDGVVFEVDASGFFIQFYGFTGGTDGGEPLSQPILDAQGNLYGTTYFGGLLCNDGLGDGCGVVYKIVP